MLRKAITLIVASFVLLFAVGRVNAGTGAEEADNIVKVLRTSNVAQVNSYVPKVYDLKYVNPFAVARFIGRPMQAEEGGFWTFAAPNETSGKVLVVCPKHMIPSMDELIAKIDRPNLTTSAGEKRQYVEMKHRSVADTNFVSTLSDWMSNGVASLITDPQTDALYLKDTPVAMPSLLDAIAQFDVPTAEVAVDVTVYEVDVANDNSLGLDFHAWKNGPGRNLFALGGFGEYEKADYNGRTLINGVSQGPDAPMFDSGSNILGLPAARMNNYGWNAAYYYQVPSAYFDALNVKGKARIVNKTRVSILNGYTGEIASGDEILYYQVQNGPAPVGGYRTRWLDPLGRDATYPDNRTVVGKKATTGVALEVTPTIGTDMITLDVDYVVGTLTGFDGEGVPMIAERQQSSTVRVKDGEEVVLGGVVRDAKVQTTRKVPVLGSIPVLGYWFGGEISTAQKSMVVVILKPTVVQNFNNLTAEDQDLLAKVKGDVAAPLQPDQYGWDMYFMGR